MNQSQIPKDNWKNFYRGAEEALPPDAPEELGNPSYNFMFVDANHASNQVTH
jgi:hypothetical protein